MTSSGALSIFGHRITAFSPEAKAELAGLMRVGQVTTATSVTVFASTDLIGQDDDAFDGWYVSVLQADNAAPEGEMKPMSDYVSSTGTITHTAFTQQLAVGDWVVLLRPEIAVIGQFDTAAATGAVTTTDELMAYAKQLVTNSRRVVHYMDFWSEVDDLITLNASAADETLPSVVVAEIPSGAVVLRVIAMIKIGAFEDTSTAENKLVLAGNEHIQIDKTGGTYIDAIKLIAGQWLTGASAVRGGDVMIGNIDVASEVDGNDTYEMKIENADVTGASLLLRDVQTGLRVYFTLE